MKVRLPIIRPVLVLHRLPRDGALLRRADARRHRLDTLAKVSQASLQILIGGQIRLDRHTSRRCPARDIAVIVKPLFQIALHERGIFDDDARRADLVEDLSDDVRFLLPRRDTDFRPFQAASSFLGNP